VGKGARGESDSVNGMKPIRVSETGQRTHWGEGFSGLRVTVKHANRQNLPRRARRHEKDMVRGKRTLPRIVARTPRILDVGR